MIENIVAIELMRRGYEIYTGILLTPLLQIKDAYPKIPK